MAPADDTLRADVDLVTAPLELLSVVVAALDRLGDVVDIEEAGPVLGARAVVPSGALGLNPARVEVVITPLDGGVCRLSVTGTAKEGLIKQRAGEQAVRRVLAELGLG